MIKVTVTIVYGKVFNISDAQFNQAYGDVPRG